jgi:hypothetical protein
MGFPVTTVLGGRSPLVFALLLCGCSGDGEHQPTGPTGPSGIILASGQNNPSSIAVDATSVYWTNLGTSPGFKDGSIMKISLDGESETVLASGVCQPSDIIVDDTSVYWTEYRCDSSPSRTMKMPLGGGPTVTLADDCGGWGLAVGGGFAYCFGFGTGWRKVPVEGGAPTTLSGSNSLPLRIAADAVNVYRMASTADRPGFQLIATPHQGAVSKVLVAEFHPTLPFFAPIASDGSHVYYTDAEGDELKAVSVDGGVPVKVAAGQGRIFSVAAHGAHVYWCSAASDVPPSTVARTPTGGGDTEVLAIVDGCGEIAVDGESVYWIGGGRVRKVAHE